MAPAGTPDAIVTKINGDLLTALAHPEVREKFATLGTYMRPLSPADTAAFIGASRPCGGPLCAR